MSLMYSLSILYLYGSQSFIWPDPNPSNPLASCLEEGPFQVAHWHPHLPPVWDRRHESPRIGAHPGHPARRDARKDVSWADPNPSNPRTSFRMNLCLDIMLNQSR
jgi:hypothetical protein